MSPIFSWIVCVLVYNEVISCFEISEIISYFAVNEFSKKTGDFASLSLADIKVLALTYELEVEAQGGSGHLRSEPEKTVTEYSKPKKITDDALKLPGFYYPSEQVISFSNRNFFVSINDAR